MSSVFKRELLFCFSQSTTQVHEAQMTEVHLLLNCSNYSPAIVHIRKIRSIP